MFERYRISGDATGDCLLVAFINKSYELYAQSGYSKESVSDIPPLSKLAEYWDGYKADGDDRSLLDVFDQMRAIHEKDVDLSEQDVRDLANLQLDLSRALRSELNEELVRQEESITNPSEPLAPSHAKVLGDMLDMSLKMYVLVQTEDRDIRTINTEEISEGKGYTLDFTGGSAGRYPIDIIYLSPLTAGSEGHYDLGVQEESERLFHSDLRDYSFRELLERDQDSLEKEPISFDSPDPQVIESFGVVQKPSESQGLDLEEIIALVKNFGKDDKSELTRESEFSSTTQKPSESLDQVIKETTAAVKELIEKLEKEGKPQEAFVYDELLKDLENVSGKFNSLTDLTEFIDQFWESKSINDKETNSDALAIAKQRDSEMMAKQDDEEELIEPLQQEIERLERLEARSKRTRKKGVVDQKIEVLKALDKRLKASSGSFSLKEFLGEKSVDSEKTNKQIIRQGSILPLPFENKTERAIKKVLSR